MEFSRVIRGFFNATAAPDVTTIDEDQVLFIEERVRGGQEIARRPTRIDQEWPLLRGATTGKTRSAAQWQKTGSLGRFFRISGKFPG